MTRATPEYETLKAALALAVRAPSIHNTQPWQWRVGDNTVHLYADPTRQLTVVDPDQRDLVLSCGAALHHFRVAAAALGWATIVHRLPNPAEPNHLAAVEIIRHRATVLDMALAEAIAERRTDRRRYSDWPVPAGHLTLMAERAGGHGVLLKQLRDGESVQLGDTIRLAAHAHAQDPEYQLELTGWSGKHASADGIPARSTPLPDSHDEIPARRFAAPELADHTTLPDGAELLILGTKADDRMSWLRAGEAMSAVLLTATNIGLATCLLTEPLELPELRRTVRTVVLDDWAYPQAVIRVGWTAISAAALPATPRRPLDDVVAPLDPADSQP